MSSFSVPPGLVFVLSFVCMWLAAVAGVWVRQLLGFDEKKKGDLGLVVAATLTLLGLLIGFSFSMAASRYDQRKNLEEAEANAIGTEYLRADLLPAADGARVRALLKQYVELRVQFYQAGHGEVAGIDRQTAKLQAELWAAVATPAGQQPNPVMALVVAGMNDVINAQGYTQAAWWNRIPLSAGLLMIVIALLCNMLIGYASLSVRPRSIMLLILPLFTAMAFMLINDIDTPRRGLVNVTPKNLLNLFASLKA